jgi:hypothetical protein
MTTSEPERAFAVNPENERVFAFAPVPWYGSHHEHAFGAERS